MGNKAPGEKPSKKSQANQVLDSGEANDLGSGGAGLPTLTIPLDQIQPLMLTLARVGDGVEVRWQGTEYGVFQSGQLLGVVPGNYQTRLAPPTPHHGTITELSQQPRKVLIAVTL